jgi:hypothetical protein
MKLSVRPAGVVIAATRLQIALLRLTGNRAFLARQVLAGSVRPEPQA